MYRRREESEVHPSGSPAEDRLRKKECFYVFDKRVIPDIIGAREDKGND